MTTIEIKNISKIINKNVVLNQISFAMESGNIYGMQGVNGSGKTMLMRMLIGLIHPTEGEIYINGKLLGKDIEFPESIGFLLENPTFLGRYSGLQNLKMLASMKNVISEEDVIAVFQEVGLDKEAMNKKYRKYSLGMKQRLGIAAAIMEKPDIILLDEPTNALDESGIDLVKNIVQRQKERGALVVISCHDSAILQTLSDYIIKLKEGSIDGEIFSLDKSV